MRGGSEGDSVSRADGVVGRLMMNVKWQIAPIVERRYGVASCAKRAAAGE